MKIQDLEKSKSMEVIRAALRHGRPSTTDIIPGTVLRHFLYKSKGNVQFVMPSYEPEYGTLLARRRWVTDHSETMVSINGMQIDITVPHPSCELAC